VFRFYQRFGMIRDRFLVVPSRTAVVALVAASVIGCQALKDALPTKPSDPTPAPSQAPVAIPVILPAPQPTPTPVLGGPTAPTPAPDPGATPKPAPTAPPPSGSSCNLGRSNFPDAPCSMQTSSFLGAVDRAMTQVTEQQPSLFDFSRNSCANCYFVKDQDAFVSAVMRNLSSAGYCSFYDGEELAVKNSIELLQRAVRHPGLLGPHPARRRIVPQHLHAGLVLGNKKN
jgi:hypothetical protein